MHSLAAFDKLEQFKLFLFDTGAILLKADYQFKGSQLQGQFVIGPRYFSNKSSKIDFVLQYGT